MIEGRGTPFGQSDPFNICVARVRPMSLTPEDEQEGKKPQWEHRGGAYGHKLEREKRFPADVFSKAWRVKLEESETKKLPVPVLKGKNVAKI